MQDFVLSQIEALQLSTKQLDSGATLSYQEQNQAEIVSVFGKYFRNLKEAYIKCPTSKIYQKLLFEYSLLGNSLWSHAADALEFINQIYLSKEKKNTNNSYILLSHFHYNSQSPLLALYCKIFNHRVKLIGSKKQIQKGWANSTIKFNQLDKITAFKSLMSSERLQTLFLEENGEDEIQNIQQKGQRLDIQIIDIFNTHATLFKPYILNRLQKQQQNKQKVILFYIHPCQIEQITQFLKKNVLKQKQDTVLHQMDLNTSFPYQTSTLTQSKLQQELISFLDQQLNHPNKQDIIIFHDSSEQFVKKIKHLFKKNNSDLSKHVNIITKSHENSKQSLPPPPAFLSKMYSTMYQSKKESTKSQSPQKLEQQKISQSGIKSMNGSNISIKSTNQASTKNYHTHNNIFIVPNYKTLIQWNNDLSHVFYIFDYRKDKTFHYDYELMCYVETQENYISPKQALLRVSCMSINKIGKYCHIKCFQQDQFQSIKQNPELLMMINDKKTKDIGYYCLTMISNSFSTFWQEIQLCKQIKFCVSALQQAEIIKKVQKEGQKYPQYTIINEQVYKCVSKIRDLNPILCSCILKAKNGCQQQEIAPAKLALQMAIATSVIMNPGCLRQNIASNNSISNRPTQIWRQSGYLHSSVDAIIRAKIIENRQQKMSQNKKSRRSVSKKLSKQTSQQYQVFGNLFQMVQADRITFDQMKIQDLLRQQLINQAVFNSIVDNTEKICEVLDIQDYLFNSFEDINPIIADFMKKTSKAVGVYSGSRRVGYLLKGQADGIFPSKSSLLTILNQKPTFVYITRLLKTLSIDNTKKIQILMCNTVPELLLVQTIGMLPSRKTKSYGQSQIEYHGVASATFKSLWRNNGSDIQSFQQKFGCFIQANQEIALISIHCPKQEQNLIKTQFDLLLKKIKEKMAQQTKIMHYLGTTSLLLTTGAKILQVIKDKYINKCLLSNLDLSVEVSDLQQLFQQFFVLKNITVERQPPSASFKIAYIQFQTQKDYYRFYQFYNECLYLNRYIKVSPIQSIPASSSYKEQMYLQFIWNAWKSNHQAVVQYETEEQANKCLQNLKTIKLHDKIVNAQIRKENTVHIKGLNSLTDEINLQLALQNYGKIKFLQILKTPLKQNLKSLQSYLQDQINKAVPNVGQIQVKKVEKLKNGLRKCLVYYKNQAKLNQTINALNDKVGIMGVGRIHIKSWFSFPIKVSHGYLSLYEQLVNHVLKKMPQNRIKIQNIIFNQQEYIMAKSHLKQQLDIFKQSINSELKGYPVQLSSFQSTILLTEVGIQNLYDLQQKYNCRLIPDFGSKQLTILTLFQNVKVIKQEIKARVQDNFFYRISLNQKSFKHFKQNPQVLQKMKGQYHLAELELQEVGRNLLLQGSANFVQKAFNYLMHLIESVSKPQEDMLNEQVCGICCQQPYRSYRLQLCGHKFCINCLLDSINSALADISMFPIKCPQCLSQVAIMDLNELMTPESWIKSNNMSLNQYVGRNAEVISSCYTAGCKQINFLIKDNFSCDQCQQSYCVKCKLNYHPGLTCQEAKQGGNAAFQKYMKENGIRKCPNQSCKMPIMRTDGCYRVTCSRCNKSMCFKCQPQKMIAYDHYNDCYKHLTDVHGGYW